MSKNENEEVHFLCPSALLKEFDEAIKGRYNNRTAAILEFMRKTVDRHLAVHAQALQKKEAT
jgi:metal-responsive CopG/Arc/MetJ family transcriptional regulator